VLTSWVLIPRRLTEHHEHAQFFEQWNEARRRAFTQQPLHGKMDRNARLR
jgi:hypothetical protein